MGEIGTYDRVHGWNKTLRETSLAKKARFRAFDWENRKPGMFCNMTAAEFHNTKVNDHQGHIVPQNILDKILSPIAKEALEREPKNIHKLGEAVLLSGKDLDLNYVTAYISSVLIEEGGAPENIFVDTENRKDAETWLGGYFSVIMWNPINIARAPVDTQRGGKPGNKVDKEVIDYMLANHGAEGIELTEDMRVAFENIKNVADLPDSPTDEQRQTFAAAVRPFIAACNRSLANLKTDPSGYYTLPWKEISDALVPGQ